MHLLPVNQPRESYVSGGNVSRTSKTKKQKSSTKSQLEDDDEEEEEPFSEDQQSVLDDA